LTKVVYLLASKYKGDDTSFLYKWTLKTKHTERYKKNKYKDGVTMTDAVWEIIKKLKRKLDDLEMPGNHRYQPVSLKPYFGHDNGARFQFDVEWALLKTLAKLDMIPLESVALLNEGLYKMLRQKITTTLQDAIERAITKHDVRALVMVMRYFFLKITKRRQAAILAKLIHIPATSYDTIETARIIAYKSAFKAVTFPTLLKFIRILKEKVVAFAGKVQIGRTHGQHAEPITAGFWLATILNRVVNIAEHLLAREAELVGKFSGAVGAYNAQVAFGLDERAKKKFDKTFEELILGELGLSPAPISTQILPPEPLARFLFESTLLSGALAQLAHDCRNLQRTEIAEIGEPFDATQDGSSSMPHKRNPWRFEDIVGKFIIIKNEFTKVLDTLFSEHQRDLTSSPVMREFPGIVVLLQDQLETLNNIIPRIIVDEKSLKRNFDMQKHLITSEAVYIALVLSDYEGDAHNLVNHTLVPRSQLSGKTLIEEFILLAGEKPELNLSLVVNRIPSEIVELLKNTELFIGKSQEKALEIAGTADTFLKKY
jgi:adenylosuccinate lyase